MRCLATCVLGVTLGLAIAVLPRAVRAEDPPVTTEDEPVLEGEAKEKHEKEVKEIVSRLRSSKNRELVAREIELLGSQRTRAGRDALIQFATGIKNNEYAKHAFDALAKIGTKRGIAFLCGKDGLLSGDFLVQHSAIGALAEAKHPDAVGPLLDVLTAKSTKIEVIGAASKAVAKTAPADERVAETLFALAENKKDTVRAYALEALGYLATDKAVARLLDALRNDKNTRVRAGAATGIEHSGRKEQIPALREAFPGESALTVKAAILSAIKALEELP